MHYVITGGAGFIGSHLAEACSTTAEVTVIDDLSTGHREHLPPSVRFVQGSILDRDLLLREFQNADCIFHQAAYISAPGSVADPLPCHEANITGTLNVLLAAREAGAGKVIFASSASVYGSSPELPKEEEMLPQPESPYAVSKIAGEHYCRVVTALYGLPTVSLRYFNVYGLRQDPHSPYAAVIPAFLARLRKGEPLLIYGDGEQTRDFVYVQDVVRANLLAMEREVSGTYNIASGTRTSVNELARTLQEILGVDREPRHEPPRPGDIRNSWADITRARDLLGFRPRYTLRQGLEEMVEGDPSGQGFP